MTDSITYTNEDNSSVLIMPQGWNTPQPCETYHQGIIDEWIAEGNTIAPYVPPVEPTAEEQVYAQVDNLDGVMSALVNTVSDITGATVDTIKTKMKAHLVKSTIVK